MLYNNKKINLSSGEREISGEKGFTLIEVLIAISIFAVGLLAVAALQITAFKGNRVGDELTKATMLAQTQIEALKSATLTSAALAPGNYADPGPIDETGAPGGRFNRSWTIAANTTFSRLVTVTVGWTSMGVIGASGGNRSVVMSTLTRGDGL